MLGNIVRRGQMPNGTDLVLWDHDDDNGFSLMTYPKAKVTSASYFGPEKGKRFCCPLNFSDGTAIKIFLQLEKGETEIERLVQYFHEPYKHAFCLGLRERETP